MGRRGRRFQRVAGGAICEHVDRHVERLREREQRRNGRPGAAAFDLADEARGDADSTRELRYPHLPEVAVHRDELADPAGRPPLGRGGGRQVRHLGREQEREDTVLP